jgi:hypothetical protein
MIPRVEISTIWFIMGFLAGSKKKIESVKSASQWKLLHRILFCDTGVLPRSLEINEKERSSAEHVKRCEVEVDFLILLISTGTLSPLDGTDRILVHIMKRLVLLQERAQNNESYLFCWDKEYVENDQVFALWNATFHDDEDRNLKKFYSDIFLMSGLIQKGVDLLEMWLRRTREKPVLWNQLDSSIRKIQEDNIDNHSSKRKVNIDFATSFAIHTHGRDAFIRDAFLAITTTLSLLKQNSFSITTRPRISLAFLTNLWTRLATPEMKVHQERICGNVDSRQSEITSDSSDSQSTYLLAIRSISIFMLANLGVPVKLSTNAHDEETAIDVSVREDYSKTEYILYYGMTCLSASLKCFCKSTMMHKKANSSYELVQKMKIAFFFIFHVIDACRLLHKNGADSSNSSEEPYKELHLVGRSALKLWAGSLSESFLAVLSLSGIDETETCFRLCLVIMRTLCAWVTDAILIDKSDEDDELIDDLEISSAFINVEGHDDTYTFHRLLIDLLRASNPSGIYSVSRQITGESQVKSLNSQSRTLLSKFSGALCACTASLIATNTCEIHSFLSGDIEYQNEYSHDRYLWFCLLNEISKLGSSLPLCKSFLQKSSRTFAISFLSMILDADSLERFSTSDYERLASLSGDKRALKEREQLRFNEGINMLNSTEIDVAGPNYVQRNLWECFQNLPKVCFDVSNNGILYQRIISISSPNFFNDLPALNECSMEMECLRRLYFLSHYLKFEDKPHLNESMEQMILFVFKTATFNLLKISDGLEYYTLQHKRISGTDKTLFSRKHGKIIVLQKCYMEIFAGLFCTSILRNWNTFSQSLRDSLCSLLESLFFSSSVYEENDVEDCLRRFVVLPGKSNATMHQSIILTNLSQAVKFAHLRRSRQFLQYLVTTSQITDRHRGVIAVLTNYSTLSSSSTLLQDDILAVTIQAFVLSSPSSFENFKARYVIERYVDEFFLKDSNILHREEVDAGIRELRIFGLTKVIPTKLRNSNEKQLQSRSALVKLTNGLLYLELKDSRTMGLHLEVILNFFDLMRSIWRLMRETIFNVTNASDILSTIFRSISLILALPVQQDSGSESKNSLISWAHYRSQESIDDGKLSLSNQKIDRFAHFVVTYAAIIYHVVSAIVDPKSESQIVFEHLKAEPESAPNEAPLDVMIPFQSSNSIDIANLFQHFRHVSATLLTETQENRPLSKNSYVKKSPRFDSISFDFNNILSEELLSEAANLKVSIQAIL